MQSNLYAELITLGSKGIACAMNQNLERVLKEWVNKGLVVESKMFLLM